MDERSVAAGDVSQSVIVTGDGNQVSLQFGVGGVVLPLERRPHPPPNRRRVQPGDRPRELDLLAADAGLLPFVGREDILGRLRAWLDHESLDVGVHGIVGRAGSGKTRLAIELCARVDSDRDKPGGSGWLAGFLRPSDLNLVVDTLATRGFDWPVRTLIVIDYAAAGAKPLARWLDRLASDSFKGRLRLLLLDREAPAAFGWWRDLTDPPGRRAVSRRNLFLSVEPEALPGLEALDQRAQLFWAAAEAASRLHGGEGPAARPRRRPMPTSRRAWRPIGSAIRSTWPWPGCARSTVRRSTRSPCAGSTPRASLREAS